MMLNGAGNLYWPEGQVAILPISGSHLQKTKTFYL